ncbi:MAG: low affinity iron permease family protein [Hyphomonadaceae bacterium]
MNFSRAFTGFANATARVAGKPAAFFACVCIIVLWAATGPALGFSQTWQLVINTGTTIITFLMVFLVQSTQNRDNAAIQAKLDELIRVGDADNKFIGIEHLTDEELNIILEEVETYATQLHRELRQRKHAHSAG